MLGRSLDDDVESGWGTVAGFGLLPVSTRFEHHKITRRRHGIALGHPVTGYQIHHGRVRPEGGEPFVVLDDGEVDGVAAGRVMGTTLHGLLEADGFRRASPALGGRRAGKRFVPADVSFEALRQDRLDRLADVLEEHLDLVALRAIVAEGRMPVAS